MGVVMKKALESNFNIVKNSDFTLICGNKKFEVHEIILENYPYFERVLRGTWKETVERVYTAEEDPVVFEAIVKFMYGETEELFSACTVPSVAACLAVESWDQARAMAQIKQSLVKRGAWKHAICFDIADPTPWQARLASDIAMQMLPYYFAAAHYELLGLQDLTALRLHGLINSAWNHPDIVGLISLIVEQTPPEDKLHEWLMCEIEARISLLLDESAFTEAWEAMPTRLVKHAMSNSKKGKADKASRYCSYSSRGEFLKGNKKVYCRRNVQTITVNQNKRQCPNCKHSEYLGPARTMLWTQPGVEDTTQPPKKKARKSCGPQTGGV